VFPVQLQFFLAILLICAVQSLQTITLHFVELLVNMSRDEAAWRIAAVSDTSRKFIWASGATLSTNPFVAASVSWENVILFALKAALHWLVGRSIMVVFSNYVDEIDGVITVSGTPQRQVRFDMMYSRILISSCLAIFLALFATYISRRRPGGPQPSTWGNLQTLVDLIDDWDTDKDGEFWWGDKGVRPGGIRHAGTSKTRDHLGAIDMNAFYSG
jgi:hypothetical protein